MKPKYKAITSVGSSLLVFGGLWLGAGWDPLIPALLAAGTWGGLQLLIPSTNEEESLGLTSGPYWVPEEDLDRFLRSMRGNHTRLKKLGEVIEDAGAKQNVQTICLRLDESLKYLGRTRQLLPSYKSMFEIQVPNIENALERYYSVKSAGVNNADTELIEKNFLPKMVKGFTALRDGLSNQERQDLRAVVHTTEDLFDMEGFNLEEDAQKGPSK